VTEATHRERPGTVLVTGSTGAIGQATVAAFLAEGCDVVGFDRRDPGGAATAGHRHVTVDLGDYAAVGRAVQESLAGTRLVHVVGIAGGALPEEPTTRDDPVAIDIATFRASLEANLTTQFIVLRACLPVLSRIGDGDRSVTFTSSFNALSAQGMPAYSAAKAGLIGLMHGLVRPLGRQGIRVNVVAPGTVRTPRTEALWAAEPGHFERLEAGTALGRLATPADVAAAYVSVALRLRHLTGQVLVLDGGQTVIHDTDRSADVGR
jgi:NAD(P)-dependent dehydrogenase (short-subunit alcohol dehydrogenase family)